uniref:Uncharacterized protein n=1 Tax=Panagrolaimus sp. ES5 TaxID=591445 RepID=A0AC34GY69_9BILA
MENVQQPQSPRTSPTKISEIETDKKAHELKIFKTSKPIKESPDDRALTSSSSSKKQQQKSGNSKEEKHGFFHKFGFGSKSASVSPVKNILSIPRRSSEIHDEKNSRKIQRKNVEATEKLSSSKKVLSEQSKMKVKNDKNDEKKKVEATAAVKNEDANANANVKIDEYDKSSSRNHSPISSYEDQSIAAEIDTVPAAPETETGTESDARVSQTIIMKKRTLHEAKTEATFLPFGNIFS